MKKLYFSASFYKRQNKIVICQLVDIPEELGRVFMRKLFIDIYKIGLVIKITGIGNFSKPLKFRIKQFILQGIPEPCDLFKFYR